MNPLLSMMTGGNPSLLIFPAALVGALSLTTGAWVVVHEHDAKVIAEVAAQQATVAAQAQAQQDQRTIADLTTAHNTAIARLNALASLKEIIHAAPQTNTCASAPAIVALVGGLRGSQGGSNAHPTPTPAGRRVAVSSPAGAAAGR